MWRFCGLRISLQDPGRRVPCKLYGAHTPPLRAGTRWEQGNGTARPYRDTTSFSAATMRRQETCASSTPYLQHAETMTSIQGNIWTTSYQECHTWRMPPMRNTWNCYLTDGNSSIKKLYWQNCVMKCSANTTYTYKRLQRLPTPKWSGNRCNCNI